MALAHMIYIMLRLIAYGQCHIDIFLHDIYYATLFAMLVDIFLMALGRMMICPASSRCHIDIFSHIAPPPRHCPHIIAILANASTSTGPLVLLILLVRLILLILLLLLILPSDILTKSLPESKVSFHEKYLRCQ